VSSAIAYSRAHPIRLTGRAVRVAGLERAACRRVTANCVRERLGRTQRYGAAWSAGLLLLAEQNRRRRRNATLDVVRGLVARLGAALGPTGLTSENRPALLEAEEQRL
jgi:hypothetical protein